MSTTVEFKALTAVVDEMLNSRVSNYATAGLHSYLVGGPSAGKVRLFHAERDTREFITPHSHRFNFACLVLSGRVENRIFSRAPSMDPRGDLFVRSIIRPVDGGLGKYVVEADETPERYIEQVYPYVKGDVYTMSAYQIHSINFAANTDVLFFEGPSDEATSVILEPFVNGKHLATFKTEEWMFEHE